jgi:hypothetical protein
MTSPIENADTSLDQDNGASHNAEDEADEAGNTGAEEEYQSSPRGKMFYEDGVRLQLRYNHTYDCLKTYRLVWDQKGNKWIYYPYSS